MHDIDQTAEQMVRSVLAYAENRLRMNPVPLDKGTLPADRALRASGRTDPGHRPASGRGARHLRVGDRAQRHLGGQPAVPRLHPGGPDQGQPALRHARLLRLDPGHLLARGVGRDRGREHRAAADRRRGRAARRRRAAASSPAAPPATCRRSRSPARQRSATPAQTRPGRRWRVVVGTDAHSSIVNTLRLLEMDALVVETPDHRLTAETVQAAIDADPDLSDVAAVVCTSGTTNAGIIDDLAGVGALARERGWWFHVDGAYGGAGIFAPSLRPEVRRHRAGRLVHPRPAQVAVHAVRLLRAALPRAGARPGDAHPGRVVPRRHPRLVGGVEPDRLRLPPHPSGARAAAVVLAGRERRRGLPRRDRGRGVAGPRDCRR